MNARPALTATIPWTFGELGFTDPGPCDVRVVAVRRSASGRNEAQDVDGVWRPVRWLSAGAQTAVAAVLGREADDHFVARPENDFDEHDAERARDARDQRFGAWF